MGETSREAGLRPTPGEVGLALVAALAVLAIGLGGAERSQSLAAERRATQDREVVAEVAVPVVADLQEALGTVSRRRSTVPGARVVPVAVDPAGGTCPARLPPELDQPTIAGLLRAACDSGDAVVGRAVDASEGPVLPIAVAHYGTDPVAPSGTVARRAAVQGWTVALVDVAAVVAAHQPRGAVMSVRNRDVVFGDGVAVRADLPEQVLELGGQELVLRGGSPDRPAVMASTVALALAGPAAALLAAGAILFAGRRMRALAAERATAFEQVRLIGEVAPLVQQSLDLADVLPAVALQLTDHFDLAGIRLSGGTSSATQSELFSLGARPLSTGRPMLAPPDELAAGATLNLALQRGGRSVALLQVVAGRALDRDDLQFLRAVTELITAAVVNASLYASQQEAVRRLRDLDALKTVFLSTASHELRTPATAIGGFAALLSTSWDRFDEAQRREFAGRIAANARSLSAVVQDLLDFSLLDRGSLDLRLGPVDLGELVGSVIDRLGPVLPEHEVVCDLRDVPPVSGNTNGLERVTTNLLTNAAKFSPAGSTITVEVVPRGEGAMLAVCDEGPGVPPNERDQVFTRFYRGSGEAVVRTRGVGIGLSVVAELTERMGGSVTVDDAPGGGARFAVWLPTAVDSSAPEEVSGASPA